MLKGRPIRRGGLSHERTDRECRVRQSGVISPPSQTNGQRPVEVEIISDAICFWCYVAKRRFEKAIAGLPEDVRVSVRWLPFELNPQMPSEGMDRVAYRSRKFGSWERSQKLDAQVTVVAAQEGIAFQHDLASRTPNTFNAHRLVWLGEREGVQDAVVEAVFRAYFVEGRDIGDVAVLADLAAGVGIASDFAAAFLASDEGAKEVSQAEFANRERGVQGVPTFVINGQPVFSGAQRSDLMLDHLLDAATVS
jgi:predicted DsbA family dithiol-disulfide isomerase